MLRPRVADVGIAVPESRAPQPARPEVAPSRLALGRLRLRGLVGLASRVSASARRQGHPQPS